MKLIKAQFLSALASASFLLLGRLNGAADTVTYSTAGSFTWTVPAGVTSVQVECWGGGGAGGSGLRNPGSGNCYDGGGGGGAYARSAVAVVPGTVYTVSVGAGGPHSTTISTTAGSYPAANGTNSWFGIPTTSTTNVLAVGGVGGQDRSQGGTSSGGAGGAAASCIGTTTFSGGAGQSGTSPNAGGGGSSAGTSANGNNATTRPNGGAAPTGGGAGGTGGNATSPKTGSIGGAPGGGGGGAVSTGTQQNGGDGAAGQVVLTYTINFDHVNVETAADGSGSLVSAQSVSSGSSITVYAIGRAADGSFMSNCPASWSLVNVSGSIVSGDLIPAGDAKSAVFTAHLSGSANIKAAAIAGNGTDNTSGTITVPATGVISSWNVDSDGNWTIPGNWSSGLPSAAGDTAILGVGMALRTITLDAGESLGGINFTNPNSFVIGGGNTLTLDNSGSGASVLVSGGIANAIQTSVSLNDNAAVTVNSGKSLTFAGAIANASTVKTLTFSGAGTNILSTVNSYGPAAGSTGTILNAGTLQVGNNNALAAGDVSVTGSSTLQAGAAGLSVGNKFSIASGQALTVDNNGNNLSLGGVISGSGSLTKVGNGTLTLGNANTYSGSTTIGAGTLSISADASLGAAPGAATANSIVLGSSTADLLSTATISLNANRGIGIGASSGSTGSTALMDVASGQSLTINSVIASAGNTGANGLTFNSSPSGGGTVILGGANTMNGTVLISSGTLQLANSLALQSNTLNYASGSLVFGSALTTATFGGLNGSQDLSLLNAATTPAAVALTVGGNNASTAYSGALTGTGASLTKVGTGTLTLTGNNNYSGATTVNGGILQLNAGTINGAAVNLAASASPQVVVNGGTLTSSALSTVGQTSSLLISSGAATFNGGLQTDLGGSVNNADLISVTGSGSLTAASLTLGRTAQNNSSQPSSGSTANGLYVNGGTVNITGNLNMGTVANANSTVNTRIDSGSLSVGGALTIGLNNGGRWSQLDVTGGTLTVNDTTTGISIGGPLAGNAVLLVRGGTTTAGKIGFGQGTTVETAVLNMTGGSLYIGSGGIGQVSTGAGFVSTVTLNGGVLGASADWSSAVPMTLGGTSIQCADASSTGHNIALSGVLSGTTLTKTGAGTLTLNSSGNTFNGLTTISAGTLNINSEWALGGANYAGLTFNGSGGTLQYAATLLNATTDISTKPVTLSADAAIDVNGNAITFANAIGNGGTGALTVKSTLPGGVLSLNGANTYTGNTTITGGAALGGTGTVGGLATFQAGSILAPGTLGVGTFHFNNLTLNATSTNDFAVTSAGGAANKVVVAGELTPSGSVIQIKSGTALLPGTNVLFTYGTINGAFSTVPVFDVAPVHPAAIVDDGSGNIKLVVPNHAPVASDFSFGATIGVPATVQVIGGKFAPTDADGDVLTVTGATGAANGSVTTDGTNITYTATSGTSDSFTYTVSDGFGGVVTKTMNVTISATGESMNQLSAPESLGGGDFKLSYLGIPGYKYALDWTSDLTPPVTWLPQLTNTAASNGSLMFTNNQSGPSGYWRTRYVP